MQGQSSDQEELEAEGCSEVMWDEQEKKNRRRI